MEKDCYRGSLNLRIKKDTISLLYSYISSKLAHSVWKKIAIVEV